MINLKSIRILISDSRTRPKDWEKGPEKDEEGGKGQDQGRRLVQYEGPRNDARTSERTGRSENAICH